LGLGRLTSGWPVYSFHWPEGKDATEFILSGGDVWAEIKKFIDFAHLLEWPLLRELE
jgi:hypothetical protein